MPHLLTLPRELRDAIIELTLLCPRSTSRHITELEAIHLEPVQDATAFVDRKKAPFSNFTDTVKPDIPSGALLLTCKQLHFETKDAIHRLWSRGLEYEMEAHYVQRTAWFLSWRHVPKLERRINKLTVFVRTLAGPEAVPFTYSWGSSNGLEHLIPLMFSMLQGLLHTSRDAKKILVEHLEIDFLISKEEAAAQPCPGAPPDYGYKSLELVHISYSMLGTQEAIEPETMCTRLRADIRSTLAQGSELERSLKLDWYGDVTLKIDGVNVNTIDVRAMLQNREK